MNSTSSGWTWGGPLIWDTPWHIRILVQASCATGLDDVFLGVGNEQGSLNYPFGGNQIMQMYGNFEGFPWSSALFELVIHHDPWWIVKNMRAFECL